MTVLADLVKGYADSRASTSSVGAAEPEPVELLQSTGLAQVPVDSRVAAKALKRVGAGGDAARRRFATLSLLMARLSGVEFDEVARLLSVKPAQLEKWLHGKADVPGAQDMRLEKLIRVLHDLSAVLKPEGVGAWLNLQLPDIDRTPAEMIRRGEWDRLSRLTRSYLDPGFG